MAGSTDDWAVLDGHAAEAAPRLLGSLVVHEHPTEGRVGIRLTEVEAYQGPEDPGSHAHRGRTDRNQVMFGPSGHLYVYRIYGMHDCANIVCSPEGVGAGVLLRAGEVVEGLELARSRRPGASDRDLARGPARLARALGLDRSHGGADLRVGPVTLHLAAEPAGPVRTGPRVGLRLAADFPWRFW
ncbi:DNA-3-methyladenine glycosylase, partial [Nocardioides massiliensis]